MFLQTHEVGCLEGNWNLQVINHSKSYYNNSSKDNLLTTFVGIIFM